MGNNGSVERRTVLKAAGASLATLGLAATTGCGGGSGSGDGTVDDPLRLVGCRRAGEADQPVHRALREEVPEDQGEDGLPGLRGLLGEVPDPGRGRKSTGRIPERRRISAEVRQEKCAARSQAPSGRGKSEPGELPRRSRKGRRGRRKASRSTRRIQHHVTCHRREGIREGRHQARSRAGPGTSTSTPSRRSTTRRRWPATPATSGSCTSTTSTSVRTARRSSPRTDSASTRPI